MKVDSSSLINSLRSKDRQTIRYWYLVLISCASIVVMTIIGITLFMLKDIYVLRKEIDTLQHQQGASQITVQQQEQLAKTDSLLREYMQCLHDIEKMTAIQQTCLHILYGKELQQYVAITSHQLEQHFSCKGIITSMSAIPKFITLLSEKVPQLQNIHLVSLESQCAQAGDKEMRLQITMQGIVAR